MATICPTGRPVARRMEPKKRKNRRLRVTISRMQTRPLWTNWPQYLHVGWGPRRNNPANFFWKSTQGFCCWQTPKYGISHFPFLHESPAWQTDGIAIAYAQLALFCRAQKNDILPNPSAISDANAPIRNVHLQIFIILSFLTFCLYYTMFFLHSQACLRRSDLLITEQNV